MVRRTLILLACLALVALTQSVEAAPPPQAAAYKILLRSRQFTPARGIETAARSRLQSGASSQHLLLQLDIIPSQADKQALAASGIRLLQYLPSRAWFASVDANAKLDAAPVRWVGDVQRADKMPDRLTRNAPFAHALDKGSVTLRSVYYADVSEAAATDAITRHNGVVTQREAALHTLVVRLPLSQIGSFVDEDVIQWLAEAPPPPTPANDSIRQIMRVNQVQAAPYNLSGSGVKVGQWDCTSVWPHPDFAGRLTTIGGENTSCSNTDPTQNHATHVAGILAGSGANSQSQGGSANQWKGVAPGAQIISYDFYNSTSETQSAINTYNIDLSQNSWGFVPDASISCELIFGNYSNLAPDYDQIVTGALGKRIAVTFAAGNAQQYNPTTCHNFGTITPPATAKNVIAVGATNSRDDSMTSFSSWGPTDDGRTKPDVVAPGYRDDFPGTSSDCTLPAFTGIKSTCVGGGYGLDFGTSMATPAVSGMLALLLQQYRQTTCITTPLPSTLKALAIHGAIDLGNTGPDFKFGWGRVDAKNSVDLIRAHRVVEGVVSTGGLITFTANVTSSSLPLKATLVWDDAAASDGALAAYINDLDLTLIAPNGAVFNPWLLDPSNPNAIATSGADHRNNVEQVYVANPMLGMWTIRVAGTAVPQAPQHFSVVSDALNTPTLNALVPAFVRPGMTIVLRGSQFNYPCSPSSILVNFGAQSVSVASANFSNDTITVTVPITFSTGSVSVTTPAGTSNALTLTVVPPRIYMPSIVREFPPQFNWLDVSGGTRIVSDDDVTQTVALPFPFKFYGNSYTSVNVSSNGFISFSPLTDSFHEVSCIPSSAWPNNAIYAFWADLVPALTADGNGNARAVWTKTVGNSFVIEWQQVPRYTLPDIETFEIVLGADNSIILQYLSVSNTRDVVVGVENATGTNAQEQYCNHSNPPVVNEGVPPADFQLLYFSTP